MKLLEYIDDGALCISRKPYGRGYRYYDASGNGIVDSRQLRRFRSLAIPPMWNDVMICKLENGHIQVVGRDAKSRKQYIYHPLWQKQQQAEKFKKMRDFSLRLPHVRAHCLSDLQHRAWDKDKVTALIVLILDEYGIRIGNDQYRRKNGTYGLTNLRRKHLELNADEVVFTFKGKSNKEREVHIDDPELMPFIKESASLPGYEIFRYRDSNGTFQNIDSEDINDFIHREMGDNFSSKDFRTWAACRSAIEFYPMAVEQRHTGSKKRLENIVIKMVSQELGNTPAICRDYYIHPKIYDRIKTRNVPDTSGFLPPQQEFDLSQEEQVVEAIIKS